MYGHSTRDDHDQVRLTGNTVSFLCLCLCFCLCLTLNASNASPEKPKLNGVKCESPLRKTSPQPGSSRFPNSYLPNSPSQLHLIRFLFLFLFLSRYSLIPTVTVPSSSLLPPPPLRVVGTLGCSLSEHSVALLPPWASPGAALFSNCELGYRPLRRTPPDLTILDLTLAGHRRIKLFIPGGFAVIFG